MKAPSRRDRAPGHATRSSVRVRTDCLYRTLGAGSVLARFGVGYDGIDLTKATRAGILCTNTPGMLDPSVAEITMMFIAAAARHLVFVDSEMRKGNWTPRTGVELAGKTVAIIGSGRIGAATAKIAGAGFGMRVIGCRRSMRGRDDSEASGVFHEVTADFRAAVEKADYVVLLIPGTPENTQFLNRERLSMLPPHAWLINTARGSVVDESALYDALVENRIAGLATDVFAHEPYEPVDPARDLRTLKTPFSRRTSGVTP
jgi:phosphoglycerate dehydrogenase-like enzyme